MAQRRREHGGRRRRWQIDLFFDIGGMDSTQMCEYLLENAGVVGMPGSAYGEETACCMRFSFANATEDLERAARKITDALLKLQQK